MKLKNKLIALLCVALIFSIVAPVVAPENPVFVSVAQAASVKISVKKATIYVGQTLGLDVIGSDKNASWSSSNTRVATVNSSGMVTAKSAGKANITAKIGSKKYKCKVTVKKSGSTKDRNKSYYKYYLKPYMDLIGDNLKVFLNSSSQIQEAFANAKKGIENLEKATSNHSSLKNDSSVKSYLSKMKDNIQEGHKRSEKVASSDATIMSYQQNAVKNLKSYMDRVKKLLGIK